MARFAQIAATRFARRGWPGRVRGAALSHPGMRVRRVGEIQRPSEQARLAACDRVPVCNAPKHEPASREDQSHYEEGCNLRRCTIMWTRCARDSNAPIMRVTASWNMLFAT